MSSRSVTPDSSSTSRAVNSAMLASVSMAMVLPSMSATLWIDSSSTIRSEKSSGVTVLPEAMMRTG